MQSILSYPVLKLVCPCYRISHERDDARLNTIDQPLPNLIPTFDATREESIPNLQVGFIKSRYSRLYTELDLSFHNSTKMAVLPQPTHDSRLASRLWVVTAGTILVLFLLSGFYTDFLRSPLDYAESKANEFCQV
jgi:hypothetical protein